MLTFFHNQIDLFIPKANRTVHNNLALYLRLILFFGFFVKLVFFFLDKVGSPWIRLTVFAALFLALRVWLYVNKVKLFFTEKQA